MENKGKNVNEKQLWHGTSADLVDHIAHQNFDWRLCKRGAYGSGSYFAKNASYSNGYTTADQQGVKWMFYADVLVGDYAQVKLSLCKVQSHVNQLPGLEFTIVFSLL